MWLQQRHRITQRTQDAIMRFQISLDRVFMTFDCTMHPFTLSRFPRFLRIGIVQEFQPPSTLAHSDRCTPADTSPDSLSQ